MWKIFKISTEPQRSIQKVFTNIENIQPRIHKIKKAFLNSLLIAKLGSSNN